jgi:leucyl-tRNA synthetase
MTEETKPAYDRWNLRDDSEVEYGYLSKTSGAGIADAPGGFYITTAINYTNGPAHMGHAYEATTSDVIARFQRLKGTHPTYFVTGADEHGQKIANTAAEQGKEPIDICNKVREMRQN